MDWFLYDNGLLHERVKISKIDHTITSYTVRFRTFTQLRVIGTKLVYFYIKNQCSSNIILFMD